MDRCTGSCRLYSLGRGDCEQRDARYEELPGASGGGESDVHPDGLPAKRSLGIFSIANNAVRQFKPWLAAGAPDAERRLYP